MAETMLGPTVFVIVHPSLEQYGIAIVIAQEERIPLSGNCQIVEARVGIEPTHKGFADLSLTTWVPRHSRNYCVITKGILHSKPLYSILKPFPDGLFRGQVHGNHTVTD